MNELLCIPQVERCFKSHSIFQVIIDLSNKHASVPRIYWSQKTLWSVKQQLDVKPPYVTDRCVPLQGGSRKGSTTH